MPASTHPNSKLLTLWESLLGIHIPWLGSPFQRFAVYQISRQLRQGNPDAVSALIAGLNPHSKPQIQALISAELSGELAPACIDRLWEEWSAGRQSSIETILLAKKEPARAQSTAWAFSQAKLGLMHMLYNAAPSRIAEMISLLPDHDPVVAANAHSALLKISQQASRDELYAQWAASRSADLWLLALQAGFEALAPANVRALYLLKRQDQDSLLHASADLIPPMVSALTDPDPIIAVAARRYLPMLQNQAAVDALAGIWSKSRTPLLAKIINEGRLLPSQPFDLRLLVALLIGRDDIAREITPDSLVSLLSFSSDRDARIAAAARTALISLALPETKSALCMHAVYQNDTAAFQLALDAGYRPEKSEQRALFVFLAGLMDEYQGIDFDQRLMRAIYETSQPDLRQRIALQVQRSGQTTLLTILAGIDYRTRAAKLTGEEVRLFVELLISNLEWSRLWSLVHTLSFTWSVRILQTLSANGWNPEDETDQSEFAHLSRISLEIPLSKSSYIHDLPLAVHRATVHVNGRVNDIAFDPIRPILAIGTGARQLATWDFQKAALVRVRKGFNHSISRVAFVGQDYLVCGVRSNTDAACWVYGWQNEDAFVLPGHRGAVTALEPVNQNTLLSTGRDGAVILWDLSQRQEFHRCVVPEWPRRAIISPDRNQVAIVHSSVQMLRLPDLLDGTYQSIRTTPNTNTRPSIAQCAVFLPPENVLLLGQGNGQIVKYMSNPSGNGYNRKAVISLNSSIIGLKYLPQRQFVVSAAQNGTINFYRWPDMSPAGVLKAAGEALTSLQISPDGSFMATGTGESTMLLWDLRVLEIPALLDLPLSAATADHLAAVTSLLNTSSLTDLLRRTLELLKALLLRRFRFDIQLDELSQIKPGEFDIMLD